MLGLRMAKVLTIMKEIIKETRAKTERLGLGLISSFAAIFGYARSQFSLDCLLLGHFAKYNFEVVFSSSAIYDDSCLVADFSVVNFAEQVFYAVYCSAVHS